MLQPNVNVSESLDSSERLIKHLLDKNYIFKGRVEEQK